MSIEIFTTQDNYEIEQTVLIQHGKMCAERGEYVRLRNYRTLEKQLEETKIEYENLLKAKCGFESICLKLYSYNYAGDHKYLQEDFYHFLKNEWPDLTIKTEATSA